MLKIEIHLVQQTATLRCSGRLVLGWETETLRYFAKARPETCLILDLSRVQTVDAAGLGLLVELYCWAQHGNKVLALMNPSASLSKLFSLTNLHSVFETIGAPKADLAEAESGFERRCMTA